jgi:hypothetical protein
VARMNSISSSLDVINVASPCPASWDAMTGDNRVRHCAGCSLNVYNLSDMTRDEAEALVQQREGRLCVRFFRRADGTVITRDCPVGLRWVRRRCSRLVVAVVALVGCLWAGLIGSRGRPDATASGSSSSSVPRSPLERLVDHFAPEAATASLGMMCPPAGRITIIDEDDALLGIPDSVLHDLDN